MQAYVYPSNPNVKEEHKREGRCGFCFPPMGFYSGVFKGFIVRSALIPGLGTIAYGLVEKDKRHIGKFALVTMLLSFFTCF